MKPNLADISIHAWLIENQIKNEKGQLIEFRNHPFLFHIYADESKCLCVVKAAQVGLSTCEIIRQFYICAKRKIDTIYTLPTDEDVRTFVGGKVNRIINQNPILQQYTSDKDTIEQKKIGDSMIYYRGTFTVRKAIMVTADLLVHDEKDSSDQVVLNEYQARLQHSEYKGKHVFSHPSVPGHGVDVEWVQSDQKHWFITCPHCNKEHFMAWPDSVDMQRKVFVCKYCKGELSDNDRRKGRWVQKYKDRKYSGYWVPQLICPWVSAEEIVDKFNDPTTTIEFFWNKVLGLPYEGEGNIVVPEMILRNITSKVNNQERVVIGADSGLIKHYVVGNKEGLFHYGKTNDWKEIERLMLRLNAILVLDALPDLTTPRILQEKYPGKVYLCHYGADRKTQQLIRWGKKEEEGTVLVDRNRMIQFLIDEYNDRRIPISGRPADWKDYVEHFLNIYRVKKLDKHGRPIFTWEKKNTEDHWVHASVYWRVGMERFGAPETGTAIADNAFINANRGVEIDIDGTAPMPKLKEVFDFEQRELDDWRLMG